MDLKTYYFKLVDMMGWLTMLTGLLWLERMLGCDGIALGIPRERFCQFGDCNNPR